MKWYSSYTHVEEPLTKDHLIILVIVGVSRWLVPGCCFIRCVDGFADGPGNPRKQEQGEVLRKVSDPCRQLRPVDLLGALGRVPDSARLPLRPIQSEPRADQVKGQLLRGCRGSEGCLWLDLVGDRDLIVLLWASVMGLSQCDHFIWTAEASVKDHPLGRLPLL